MTIERELTSTNGLIADLLPSGCHWERIFDTPDRKRHTCGFDGLLCIDGVCHPCEVKVGNKELSNSERAAEKRLRESGVKHLVLRWFGSEGREDNWRLEDGGQAWQGNLLTCLKGLEG